MNRAFSPLFLSMALILPGIARSDDFNQLPPPTLAQVKSQGYTLYLTLTVNGNNVSGMSPVVVKNGHYWINAALLKANYVRIPDTSGLVDVSALPEVTAEYDSTHQSINLQVPNAWLPEQYIGNRSLNNTPAPVTSRGLLFNYDAYNVRTHDGLETTSALLEGRLFGDDGMLSQTGVWRTTWQGHDDTPQGYMRYDTTWKYSNVDKLISIQAGDFISDSLTWSHSVRMAGIRVSRNFSVRPDLVTYPLLNWNGSAAVPGTLDLFVNGYRTSRQSVNAGPYTITDVPFINGAGEATVVTTDALGRQVSTNIPFYVSNKLLAQGLSDFDFSAGALRKNYGITSDDYGQGALSGIYRYGITNNVTASLHTEASDELLLTGAGTDFTPFRWGTFSLSASHSHNNTRGEGEQYGSGWSYNGRFWNLNVQRIQTRDNYQDLSIVNSVSEFSRHSEQATLSVNPPFWHLGNFGIGYFNIKANDGTRTRLANVSWTHSVGSFASLSLSVNKNLSDNSMTGLAQLTIPWGVQSAINMTTERSATGGISNRLDYTHSAPAQGGFGWTLAHTFSADPYNQANLSWINRYSSVSGGYYGTEEDATQWAEVGGSVVIMDNDLFFSRRINDAFIVADTDGFPDSQISYENREVGVTDSHGHLLIPWVSAWYAGKVSVDPMNLPMDTSLLTPDERVSVREGSGAIVRFNIQRVRSAVLTVVDEHQQPLPPGTPVNELNSGQSAVVGYDGQVWLTHLGRKNHLSIMTNSGPCSYSFSLPEITKIPAEIGPVECHSSPEKEPLHDR